MSCSSELVYSHNSPLLGPGSFSGKGAVQSLRFCRGFCWWCRSWLCCWLACSGPWKPARSGSGEPGISVLYKSSGMSSRCDPSSPYIHPVGWCQEHGKPLTPPQGELMAGECRLHWCIISEMGLLGWDRVPGGSNPVVCACLQARAVSFSKVTAEVLVRVFRYSMVFVSGHKERAGRDKLYMQAQMFLLSFILGFMVHKEIVAHLNVSQIPTCLTQAWLVL